jgi:large subunit ribosomal protein L25
MEIYEMQAQVRSLTGKGVARKLRAQGCIPGICYRKGIESIPLSLDGVALQKVMKRGGGRNILIRLTISDKEREEDKTVMLKELQRSNLADILHVDLLEVLMDEKIVVEVAVRLLGEATEVARAGAAIQQVRRSVEIECFPGKIPEHIDVDISSLRKGDTLQVEQLIVDPEIRILTDPKEPILTILVAEEEVEEKPAEEEVPAEEEPSKAP